MRRWRTSAGLFLAGVAALAFAIPAAGQRDKAAPPPDLPPGFGDQGSAPAPKAASPAANETAPAAPTAAAPDDGAVATTPGESAGAAGEETVVPDAAGEIAKATPQIEIPEASRRPTNV